MMTKSHPYIDALTDEIYECHLAFNGAAHFMKSRTFINPS